MKLYKRIWWWFKVRIWFKICKPKAMSSPSPGGAIFNTTLASPTPYGVKRSARRSIRQASKKSEASKQFDIKSGHLKCIMEERKKNGLE